MKIFDWLMLVVGPLAKRVLIALGIGVVSYSGLALVADQIKDEVLSSLSGLSGAGYSVIAMTGFFEAVGILLGALSARVALMVVDRLARVSSPAA